MLQEGYSTRLATLNPKQQQKRSLSAFPYRPAYFQLFLLFSLLLSKFWRKQSTIDRLAGAPLLQTGAISFVLPVPGLRRSPVSAAPDSKLRLAGPRPLVGWDTQMESQLSRSSATKPSRGSAMLLLRLCQTGLAQRETQNENTQEWFSTVRKGQQSRPKKGQRVWGKHMVKRNGDFISNINWQRLDNILGRVKIKVTRIACLEDPWT